MARFSQQDFNKGDFKNPEQVLQSVSLEVDLLGCFLSLPFLASIPFL